MADFFHSIQTTATLDGSHRPCPSSNNAEEAEEEVETPQRDDCGNDGSTDDRHCSNPPAGSRRRAMSRRLNAARGGNDGSTDDGQRSNPPSNLSGSSDSPPMECQDGKRERSRRRAMSRRLNAARGGNDGSTDDRQRSNPPSNPSGSSDSPSMQICLGSMEENSQAPLSNNNNGNTTTTTVTKKERVSLFGCNGFV